MFQSHSVSHDYPIPPYTVKNYHESSVLDSVTKTGMQTEKDFSVVPSNIKKGPGYLILMHLLSLHLRCQEGTVVLKGISVAELLPIIGDLSVQCRQHACNELLEEMFP
jgi:hypothetical protein